MKYLLGYLEGLSDAPDLSDPKFQQLLVDVQAGKSQAKSSEAFNENLEKILNELKSTPESAAFHKPVSKREAPNYYDIIQKPMDLTTMLRNVKSGRYKNKADFVTDLDLIWENCMHYNTQETHPLRAAARLMKQKADHHLTFLADKDDRSATNVLQHLPAKYTSASARSQRQSSESASVSAQVQAQAPTSYSLHSRKADIIDEDAAGESDGEVDAGTGTGTGTDFRDGAKRADQARLGSGENQQPGSRAGRSASRDTSVVNGHRQNGHASGSRQSPPPFRPKLQTTFDNVPVLTRTPHSMVHYQSLSLQQSGPSFSDKGKAKEILHHHQAPAWYPPISAGDIDSEDSKLEGAWWGFVSKDEAYTSSLPSVPTMVTPDPQHTRRPRTIRKRRKPSPPSINGLSHADSSATLVDEPIAMTKTRSKNGNTNGNGFRESPVPSLLRSKPVNLTTTVHRTVDTLFDMRKTIGQITDWQKAEHEGLPLPVPKPHLEREERRLVKQERVERKRRRDEERAEGKKRMKLGGEVGEEEAALSVRAATASMLAQAGFDGANESSMDLLSRMVVERISNLGRTFRLLMDGFSHKMTPDEMVLHALYENGQLAPADIEAHIKDDIEKEEARVTEMARKMRQAYKEIATAPIIEDDMMFADNGEMLLDGNFADELGEDFLGLRDLGIAREHGMDSLSVPTSIFYGRKKRQEQMGFGRKEDGPEYPPPAPFVPLSTSSYQSALPALFHNFFAARIESGLGVGDDPFDQVHSQIGPLGQIVIKTPPAPKKKPEVEKKKKPPKVVVPGPGKGNWIRPSKEERERRAAEKRAFIAARANGSANGSANGHYGDGGGSLNGTVGSEEDAEGEEE